MNWDIYCQEYKEIGIEIGFGRSCTLLKMAPLFPETLFIGIEIKRNYYERIQKLPKPTNLLLINSDAREFVCSIPAGTISNYFIYFPSPLPLSQRIFSVEFHWEIFRSVKRSGIVKIATDDYEYFEVILSLFSDAKWVYTTWQELPYVTTGSKYRVETDCEKIYGLKYFIECYKR
jgi:tRNA G46 methylase TrmB